MRNEKKNPNLKKSKKYNQKKTNTDIRKKMEKQRE